MSLSELMALDGKDAIKRLQKLEEENPDWDSLSDVEQAQLYADDMESN